MKAITLRDVPADIAYRIEDRARRTGTSLNRTVIEMLSERTGAKGAAQHTDLDHLFGVWSGDEGAALLSALGGQRGIDDELWP